MSKINSGIITLAGVLIFALGLCIGMYINGTQASNLQKELDYKNTMLEYERSISSGYRDLSINVISSYLNHMHSHADRITIRDNILKLHPNIPGYRLAPIVDSIHKYSYEYNIDPNLAIAVAYQESTFSPEIRGFMGEYGLFQVMPFWADRLEFIEKPSDLQEIDMNTNAGIYILRHYLDKFNGDTHKALMAYNGGPLLASTNGSRATRSYARRVMANQKKLGEPDGANQDSNP